MKTRKRKSLHVILAVVSCVAVALSVSAQVSADGTSALSVSAAAAVPRLVRFAGVAKGADTKPLTGTVGITFLLYKEQQSGAPLWMETQNVQPDSRGNYTVQLGATQPDGLPTDIFASGEARWLGVQISGQEEQPRVLLLAVRHGVKLGSL